MSGCARVLLLAVGVVGIWSTPARAATKDVSVGGSSFNPGEVSINVGDTVRWTWGQFSGLHDITAESSCTTNCVNSPDLFAAGAQYQFTYTTPGTYDYYCSYHGFEFNGQVGGMAGRVVVSGVVPEPGAIASLAVVVGTLMRHRQGGRASRRAVAERPPGSARASPSLAR